MQFLIDEDLPRSCTEIISDFGYSVLDVRDIGLQGVADSEIAVYAKKNHLCLVTCDFDFSDIRNYPPEKYSGIVVLDVPFRATAKYKNNLLRFFLEQVEIVSEIKGKLAIVRPGMIRIRNSFKRY